MAAFRPRREWLLEAVSSALAQRGCRVELIVVDDGSPDRVAEMLEQIEDPRLRLLRVPHGGRSPALNAGVAAARGDFIRFIDADDYLEPGGTAHLLRLLGGDRDVISYGATLECDEQLRPMRAMTCDLDGSVATACLLDAFDVRVFSMLFPREVAEGIGGWDPVLPACRDWDYSLRAFERARVRGDRTIVTHYRRHPGGVSADLEACLRGERLVIERYFDRHPEHRGTSLERRCRARLHRTEARTYQANPSTRRAFRRSMAFALCLAPVDTLRDLGDDARSLARGFIGSLRRAALAAGPR
jgi:glycosyltransferase involved in cell wall biosynthesis